MPSFVVFLVFTVGLVITLLGFNQLLAINKPGSEKNSPYECGFTPVGTARDKFNISFFLVAILFLLFDLEILLLFPFAVSLYQVSTYGYWVAVIFLVILTVGFVFEFGRGALKFTNDTSDSSSSYTTSSSSKTLPPIPLGFLFFLFL